jgi:hypothetical protein
LLSIPGKWFLASRPVLSFRQRADRRPVPDQAECWTLRACPVLPEFLTQACPPLSAAQPYHNKRGDHWPSVSTGIARLFARQQLRKLCKVLQAERELSFYSPTKNSIRTVRELIEQKMTAAAG